MNKPLASKVVWRDLEKLHPYPRNPRLHSPAQIAKLKSSIAKFGIINPLLVDGDLALIAGHGRLAAARDLGLKEVPTLSVEHLTPDEVRAYRIADNRLAELAEWDTESLAFELGDLDALALELDLEITGFDTSEIDLLLDPPPAQADDLDEFAAELPSGPPVTQVGDLWCLDRHRLSCADALSALSYRQLMGRKKARLVFTDPPYNVPIKGHVSGLGRTRHREFPMASGEMSEAAFTDFLRQALKLMHDHCDDGTILYVMMDWKHAYELMHAAREVGLSQKNLCVWNKSNAGMGSFYRSQHELIFVFKRGNAAHINNFGLGEHGRHRTNVWCYAGANSFGARRTEHLGMHPTVKPVPMVIDALKDCSRRSDLVLDPFSGSGTTLLAAEKCRRIAYCMELDPAYVDLAISRWQALTGKDAVLAATGSTFTAVRAERLRNSAVSR